VIIAPSKDRSTSALDFLKFFSAMRKKKKKTNKPVSSIRNTSPDDFCPDPLVEGDSPSFSNLRTFCVGEKTIQYTFREHFLFFSWENNKSKNFTQLCPPAAYHLEKRFDLRNFDFFKFRLDHKRVRFYRFALEHKLCDDLLHYISEDMEADTIIKFRQSIESLRQSKILVSSKPEIKIEPLFELKCPLIGWEYSKQKTRPIDEQVDKFSEWFNNLDDELVSEEQDSDHKQINVFETLSEDPSTLLLKSNFSLYFKSTNSIPCISKFIGKLISKYFNQYKTKFKFGICAPPGFGKTRLLSIFRQLLILDVDDITIFDPNYAKKFHFLIQNREWDKQLIEYHRLIRTKFKEGLILCQHSDQLPPDIPYVNIVTPGHIGRRKLWSDRGLYDLVIKFNNKIFVTNKLDRNSLVEIVYCEIYNSLNYVSDS